ncbi:MAG: hypothetical protein KatS3mg105_1383 [Gemmatales bacterium]|nr:MAG: hypothetical protein KatS3mg105_1383 [Gemmatales bacterium]
MTAGGTPRAPARGDIIFSFDKRRFSQELDGWEIDTPPTGGWKLAYKRPEQGAAAELHVSRQGKTTVIKLHPREVVSDVDILPAMPPLNVPVVAVAAHDLGQPLLRLYDANTGTIIRYFTGHLNRIHSVAFSGDGQLLVTTADDQTVCVWSMAKLTKYLGRVGTLPGVAVKNLLAIDNVRGGAPVKGKLQPADIIDAVVYKGATKKYFSKIRLYDDLAALAPTTPVTLRIRDDQARATRQVEVRVNQGIVDRTACLLLRLGQPNPLTAISLTQASRGFSPLAGLNLKYVAAVVAAPGDQLAEGDLVETITIPGAKPKRVASARDFYITIALTRPGTRVTLGLRGKGKVVLEVKQGTDERKPLFSLFAAKAKKAGEWDWVGWNPIGPYEASGRRAEKLIGWHFNTGNPEKPAVFALADQYRKEYYREGILKDLVEQTELAQALDAWFRRDRLRELPEPRLTFWLDEVGPDPSKRNAQGQCIARATPLTIKLAIDNFPLDRIKAVHWQLGNGPARGFDSGRGRERTAVLNLPRGVYRLHAIVETSEDPPRTYSKDLVLKVLPPAPVAVSSQPRFAVTKDAEFRLEAIVTQKRAEEVRIHLVHRHRGQKVTDKMLALKADATTVRVSEPFKLLPGENVFELIAVNAKAPAEDRELESATLSWAMTYLPPKLKAAPPRIIIERIQPDPESPNSRPIAVQPGKTSRVHDSPIRLFGRIEGSDVLESAEWILGQKARTLAGFVGNQAKTFAFSQEVALQPGTQTIVLRAKSSRSEAVERSIAIEYQPRLPRVIVTAPPDDSVFFDEGTGLPAIEISGHIRRLNPYAAKAELLINGEPTPLDLPEEGDTWSKQIKLPKTGVNRLQVRLSNEWGMASVTEEIDVYVLQPPYQIRFDPVPPPKTPLIQLTARVRSPKPLIPETVQAEIDGRPIASVALERSPKDKDLWLIKLFDVPLEANKKNRVRLWVSNLDSRCRTPGEISIPFTPPAKPPAKAEVEFVTPTKDTVVTDPDLTVQFRVKSDSPLTRVELRQTAGREELRETFPVRNLAADADGYYRFQKRIRLLPRENRLYASAVNKGGETRTALVVSYLYTPVQLIVDRLEPAGPVGKPIQPTVLPDQRIAFKKPAEIARLRLRGRVRWSKDDDQEMTKVKLIRVYVNGFQQIPAVLEPPKGAERERVFVADLILNRPVDNRIEIELPDLKSDANNRREFTLDCLKPESGQRLHLLIVGVGEKDESKLTNQALLALRAQREKDTIRTPAFSEVRIYGPLTDFVTPQQVYAQLCLIKKTIDVLAGKGSPNDVVMVYYQGGEALKQNGNVFETSLSQYDKQLKRTGITFEGLQGFFDETLGAKLLWLDVAPVEVDETGKDQVADLPPEANINILRYRWISRQLARRGGINLLADWQQAMIRDNVGFLGSVTRQIADLYQKDYLNYQSFVPESLSKLLVNRKTK